jgi:hypothetical protein
MTELFLPLPVASILQFSCFSVAPLRDRMLWYQLWQKRLENTPQDRTTLNNDFAAIASQHTTSEQNTTTYENS